ncbi:MAG: hypothetical protein C4519_19250 [Desulfobacteraceae bacterium]|nr:MAG: hypothetical protein C4519_19250 [Desulfobacteraceae bacterium]
MQNRLAHPLFSSSGRRLSPHPVLVCLFLLLGSGAPLLLFPRAARSADSEAKTWRQQHLSIENRTTVEQRIAGGDHDTDLYDHWYIRGGNLADGRFDFYFSGRLHKDFDSTSRSFADDLFVSSEDRNSHWQEQLYQLYGDLHTADSNFGLRLGRQYITEAAALHLDGIALRAFATKPLTFSLFAGQAVSYYSGIVDDWAGGLIISGRPWPGGRSRLSYVHYRDQGVDETDEQLALDFWQQLGDAVHSHGRMLVLDGDYQMAAADLSWFPTDKIDLSLHGEHWQGLGQEARPYSPLFGVLGELEPYAYLAGRLTWAVAPWLSISPGVSGRFVEDGDEDDTNREYGHYDLTFSVTPRDRWTVSLTGEHWNVEGRDSFDGVTGEVEYRLADRGEIALGTAYLDYDFTLEPDFSFALRPGDLEVADGTTTRISPDVYTFFARAKYEINETFAIRMRGEIEDNSVEDDSIYRIRATLITRF